MDENNLEIRKSSVSGKGVFTKRPIKKGERICFMKGKICTINQMSALVDCDLEEGSDPLGIDDELYMDLDELHRSINHCCNPNSFLRGKNELIALRDIEKGEEIFYDYSTTMNDNKEKIEKLGGELWTMECKCNSENCRGIVSQFKDLPKNLQNYYLKNKFVPNFILKAFYKN
ncbi:SET domain-containing protein [Candidatus Pacearchaeota archaeon]|nr:SET domain-containing protein [Candidatus Pacearchaeota archaeon]